MEVTEINKQKNKTLVNFLAQQINVFFIMLVNITNGLVRCRMYEKDVLFSVLPLHFFYGCLRSLQSDFSNIDKGCFKKGIVDTFEACFLLLLTASMLFISL